MELTVRLLVPLPLTTHSPVRQLLSLLHSQSTTFPAGTNCILHKKKTTKHPQTDHLSLGMPVLPRRRQTHRRNDRDCDPGSQFCSANAAHTQGRPHRLASRCCCCTNIESGTSISAEEILLGSPGGRSRELNWPKCFTHTWSPTEPTAKTSSSTHAHTLVHAA